MTKLIPLILNFLGKLFKKAKGAVSRFAKSGSGYIKRIAKKISETFSLRSKFAAVR